MSRAGRRAGPSRACTPRARTALHPRLHAMRRRGGVASTHDDRHPAAASRRRVGPGATTPTASAGLEGAEYDRAEQEAWEQLQATLRRARRGEAPLRRSHRGVGFRRAAGLGPRRGMQSFTSQRVSPQSLLRRCRAARGLRRRGRLRERAAAAGADRGQRVDHATTRSRVSPQEFGAGPVTLIVTNQTEQRAGAHARDRRDRRQRPRHRAETGPINPGDTASLKADLREGTYRVGVDGDGIDAGGARRRRRRASPRRTSCSSRSGRAASPRAPAG